MLYHIGVPLDYRASAARTAKQTQDSSRDKGSKGEEQEGGRRLRLLAPSC
jgi:hypothetical protein